MRVVDPIVSVLRRFREQADLSQQAMAKLTGISYKTVQRIESGESDMRLRHYRKYLEVLGLTDMDVSIALYNHDFVTAEDVAAVTRRFPFQIRQILLTFLNDLADSLKKGDH